MSATFTLFDDTTELYMLTFASSRSDNFTFITAAECLIQFSFGVGCRNIAYNAMSNISGTTINIRVAQLK